MCVCVLFLSQGHEVHGLQERQGKKKQQEPRSVLDQEAEASTFLQFVFDDSDVLYLVAGVVVGGLQLAHVDTLIASGEALQVEAHQVLVHGDIGSAPVDVLGNTDGAVDNVLPVVLGDAELIGQGVAGFVLITAVHPEALAQQAGTQVLDHLAVGSLEDCQDDSDADGGVHVSAEVPSGGCH